MGNPMTEADRLREQEAGKLDTKGLLGARHAAERVEALTDGQLREVVSNLHRLRDGHEVSSAMWWAYWTLAAPAESELGRRDDLLEHARIAVDANGHEVNVWHDGPLVEFGIGDRGWQSTCPCGWSTGEGLDEDEARRAAHGHVDATGGAVGTDDGRPT